MKHFFAIFPLVGLLLMASGCDTLRRITAGKGDATAVAPVEYNTGDDQMNYVLQFKDAAVAEMERAGVPASITLAQGILESASGKSELAREANNHFGVKCGGSTWTGGTYKKKDDDRDANGELIESCFRKYQLPQESFFDHSEFLRDPRKHHRYGFLFNLEKTDYKAWARGLQSSGYATSSEYADKLINLIERYQLNLYDQPGNAAGIPANPTAPVSAGPPEPKPPTIPAGGLPANQRIGRVNDVKVVLSRPGETLEDIARRYRLKPENVADYNERHYPPGFKLPDNTRIYIQAKRTKWRGRESEHFVKEGQSMFDISQVYGIQLPKLLDRNDLESGQEPATGEKVTLCGSRSGQAIRLRDTPLPLNQPVQPGTQPGNRPATTTPDEILFDIDGGAANKPTQPATQPPPNNPNSTIPVPVRPSTTNQPYPTDPQPAQPGGWQQPGPANPLPSAPVTVPDGYHLIVKGDTLYNISKRYSLTVARLKQMNNMADDNIKLGQLLRIR